MANTVKTERQARLVIRLVKQAIVSWSFFIPHILIIILLVCDHYQKYNYLVPIQDDLCNKLSIRN